MSATTETNVVKSLSLKELQELVLSLQARIEVLEAPKTTTTGVEMTDDHARRIMSGDLKNLKHKEAAEKLNLTYGQVYSCRLGFTFKHIHKEMKDAKVANPWMKA